MKQLTLSDIEKEIKSYVGWQRRNPASRGAQSASRSLPTKIANALISGVKEDDIVKIFKGFDIDPQWIMKKALASYNKRKPADTTTSKLSPSQKVKVLSDAMSSVKSKFISDITKQSKKYAESSYESIHSLYSNYLEQKERELENSANREFQKSLSDVMKDTNGRYSGDREFVKWHESRWGTWSNNYKALTAAKKIMGWSWDGKGNPNKDKFVKNLTETNVKNEYNKLRVLLYRVIDKLDAVSVELTRYSGSDNLVFNAKTVDGEDVVCTMRATGAGGYNIQRFHYRWIAQYYSNGKKYILKSTDKVGKINI